MEIDLESELTFGNAFRYPLQSRLARRELLCGALLVFVPLLGWLWNMGHRIEMVHNMQHGRDAWPAWRDYGRLLKSGTVTALGMLFYYLPGIILAMIARVSGAMWLSVAALILLIAATIAIPGYMTHYCADYDAREIFDPLRALRRVFQGGSAYWKAWAIALSALLLSFLGLLALGVGFVVTSVWFWQVAGYSFANVFSHRYKLTKADAAVSQPPNVRA